MSDDGKESRAPLITAGNNIHHDELPKPPQGQLYDAIHNSHSHDFQGLYSPLSPSDAPPYQSRPNERFDDDDDDDARSSSSSELERGIKKHHQQQQQQQQHDTATTEEEFAPIPRYRVEWTTIVKHKWPAIFTAVVAVQAIICLAFESVIYVTFERSLKTRVQNNFEHVVEIIPLFLPLFIFGFLYQNFMVWDALRAKNTIQIFGVCLSNLALVVYTAIQIEQIETALQMVADRGSLRPGRTAESVMAITKPMLVAIPCIIAMATVLMVFCAWKLYQEFAWSVLKLIGADYGMKKRLLCYQIYIALLKIDFFFLVGFMIQLVIVVTEKWDPEFGLTIAAMPITLGILFFAAYCTRKELRWGMAITIGLYCCALAYLVFKLVRMNDTSEFWRAYYRGVRKPLTTFAVATILLLAATIVNGVYCTLNFGRGLKNHFEAAGSGGFGIGEEMMKKTRRKLDESSLHSAEPEQRMSRLTIE